MEIVCDLPSDRVERVKAEPLLLNQKGSSSKAPHLVHLLRLHASDQDIETTLSGSLQRDIHEVVFQ